MMNKSRLEAFTDAVVAIIVTILVLEFKAPDKPDMRLVFAEWRPFLVYIISFILIFSVWYDHHQLFKNTQNIDKKVYWANTAWLLCMSMIPYVTSFSGKFPSYVGASYLYLTIQVVWLLVYQWLVYSILKINPNNRKEIEAVVITNHGELSAIMATWILGFVVSWFWPPFALLVTGALSIVTIIMKRTRQ